METQKFVRKPTPPIEGIQVSDDNMTTVAEWCQGKIETENGSAEFIRVRVHHPLNDRQTKAFVGDWVLYANNGYKVYTARAFKDNFDPYEEDEPQELMTTTEPAESVQHIIHDEEVAPGVTATTVTDVEQSNEEVEQYDPSGDDVKYRDAVTGEYVSPGYAEQNPDTTVAETE